MVKILEFDEHMSPGDDYQARAHEVTEHPEMLTGDDLVDYIEHHPEADAVHLLAGTAEVTPVKE